MTRSRLRPSALVAALATAVAVAVSGTPSLAATQATGSAACGSDAGVVAGPFADVAPDDVHAAGIDCLYAYEISRGSDDRRFEPAAPTTRPQLASLLARMLIRTGTTLPASPPNAFDDDGLVHTFSIDRLAAVGVLDGRGPRRFEPSRALDRAQAAALVVRAVEHRLGHQFPDGSDAFSDDDGTVHEALLDRAAAAGLLHGVGGGRVDPTTTVSRGQLASMLARALEVIAGEQAFESPAARRRASALRPFGSCEALLGELKDRATDLVASYGDLGPGPFDRSGPPAELVGPRASPFMLDAEDRWGGAALRFVVTDGTTVFALTGNRLRAVSASGEESRLVGDLDLSGVTDGGDPAAGLVQLGGGRLLVVAPAIESASGARFALVDIADPAAMRIVSRAGVDGRISAVGLRGGALRVVVRSEGIDRALAPTTYPFVTTQEQADAARSRNLDIVARSTIDEWLPDLVVEDDVARSGRLVSCGDVAAPPEPAGIGLTTVLTLDLEGLAPTASTSVLGGGDLVHLGEQRAYVATHRWPFWMPTGWERGSSTEIHSFDLSSPIDTPYAGSVELAGSPLQRQFIDEHEGRLRVAMTGIEDHDGFVRPVDPRVDVVEPGTGGLSLVGSATSASSSLVEITFLGDVGVAGYAAGASEPERAQLVDLSDPAAPRVAGDLDAGFLTYVAPLDDGRLLVVDDAIREPSRRGGVRLSVVDVGDPDAPTVDARVDRPDALAERSLLPYTLLVDRDAGILAMTMRESNTLGVRLYGLGSPTLVDLGLVTFPELEQGGLYVNELELRPVVVGDWLYTVITRSGVSVTRLDEATRRVFVPFP